MGSKGEDAVRRAREWLELSKYLAERDGTHEHLAFAGLRFGRAERGRFVYSLTVPRSVTEEVEVESRVLTHKGKLSAVVVEIRKKASGEPVALAKQWMAATSKI